MQRSSRIRWQLAVPQFIPSQMQDAEARVVHEPAHARSALLPSKTVGLVPRLQ